MNRHRRDTTGPEHRSVRLASYGLLIPLSVLMVVPLAWLVITAFKSRSEIFQAVPRWLPEHWTLLNFPEAWHAVPFAQYYVNTILAVGGLTLLQLGTTTLAGGTLRFAGALGFSGSAVGFSNNINQVANSILEYNGTGSQACNLLGTVNGIPGTMLTIYESATAGFNRIRFYGAFTNSLNIFFIYDLTKLNIFPLGNILNFKDTP